MLTKRKAPAVLDALGDGTRRQIVERLRAGPRAVGALAAGLPVSRPAVSQHLRVLLEAGLVERQAEGTRNVYRLRPEGFAPLRAYIESFWGDVLDAFAKDLSRPARPGRKKR